MLKQLAKSAKVLVRKRSALQVRERRALADLQRFLAPLGYDVVSGGGSVGASQPAPRTRARRSSLACPRCGRRFALAMHLGRHVGAMHRPDRSQRRKRTVKKAKSRRR